MGIAWQGSPKQWHDRRRSAPLRHFAALAAVPGVRLISLQKGPGSEQLAGIGELFEVETLDDDMDADGAFVDTAAIKRQLDVVVSADTSIPHLAGALGVPTWVMLSHVAEWRWLTDRSDSPWYPSMRLFRQPARDDWPGAFAQAAEVLRMESDR